MKKTVRELIAMYRDGDGCLYTDQSTQRKFIYKDDIITNVDGQEISRSGDVIRSILVRNIQLPALYFWKVNDPENGIIYGDNEYNIHDGKQRFMSINDFIRGNGVTKLGKNVDSNEVSFNMLSEDQQNKLLNYEFDVVVREGTLKEEEESFILINNSGLPLTYYECLRGAYHGTYFTEFENYIENLSSTLDGINKIGRGDQTIWFLYMALGIVNEDKKVLLAKAKEQLELVRNNGFDCKVNDFDKKILLYNDLSKIIGSDGHIQKICMISDYIIKNNYNSNEITGYYYTGVREENDIKKWKFEIHKTAIDNLMKTPQIRCDYKRFFSNDTKDRLFSKSPKCAKCNKKKNYNELEVDHKKAWSKGGRTVYNNAQLLCKSCNTSKGGK